MEPICYSMSSMNDEDSILEFDIEYLQSSWTAYSLNLSSPSRQLIALICTGIYIKTIENHQASAPGSRAPTAAPSRPDTLYCGLKW